MENAVATGKRQGSRINPKQFFSKRRCDSPRWSNLKMNKCPMCNIDWLRMGNATFEEESITCKCSFKISEVKMSEIVADRVNKDIEEYLSDKE